MAQVKSGKNNRAAASTTAAYDLWQLRLHLQYCMAQVKSGKNNEAAASKTAAYDL
jgi:hypothetical protein